MTRWPLYAALALTVTGCGSERDAPPPDDTAPSLPRIDAGNITVSGISSGAYMATQMHVAYSDVIGGAGLIAGGPYGCAQASLPRALGPCINGDGLDIDALRASAAARAEASSIAPLSNLADDRVWLFHGANDRAVAAATVSAAAAFYTGLTDTAPVLEGDVGAAHGIPTLATGNACDTFAEPYLQACDYDAAGALLGHLLGELEPRTEATGELIDIDQRGFDGAELLARGLLYVPGDCRDGGCGLHVVFHGCKQSTDFIGDALARGAGFNEWAESNRLVVLYPQAAASRMAPMNPLGCWDWWGFTGADYDQRSGRQLTAIRRLIDRLAGRP